MICIKLKKIIDIYTVLDGIETSGDFKTDYKIALILKSIEEDVNFFQKQFQCLIQQYSEKDDNGKPLEVNGGEGIKVTPEFYIKQAELYNLDSKVNLEKLTLDDCKKCKFTIKQILALEPIIEQG